MKKGDERRIHPVGADRKETTDAMSRGLPWKPPGSVDAKECRFEQTDKVNPTWFTNDEVKLPVDKATGRYRLEAERELGGPRVSETGQRTLLGFGELPTRREHDSLKGTGRPSNS